MMMSQTKCAIILSILAEIALCNTITSPAIPLPSMLMSTTLYVYYERDVSAFELWQYAWFGAIFWTIPLIFHYVIWTMWIVKCRIKFTGHETKAWLEKKYQYTSGGKKKTTHYKYDIQYVTKYVNKDELEGQNLNENTIYSLYKHTMENKQRFHERYEEKDTVDVKYLISVDPQNQSIFYHKHHVLKEQFHSICSCVGDVCITVFILIVTAPFLGGFGLMFYIWGGFIGLSFVLLNTLIIIGFFRFLFCPCCCGLCNGEVDKWKSDPFWLKPDNPRRDEPITESEYDIFILEKLNASNQDATDLEVLKNKTTTETQGEDTADQKS